AADVAGIAVVQDLAHQAHRALLARGGRAVVAVHGMTLARLEHAAVVDQLPADLPDRTKAFAAGAVRGGAAALEPDGHLIAVGQRDRLPQVVGDADHLLGVAV